MLTVNEEKTLDDMHIKASRQIQAPVHGMAVRSPLEHVFAAIAHKDR